MAATGLPVGLTNEIITDVVLTVLGQVQVTDIKASAGATAGDHNLSEVQRITVKYKNGTKEACLTFIVKEIKPSVSPFVNAIRAVEKENSWYECILPEVNKLGVDIAANCYKKFDECLLLEDLTPLGYRVAERKKLLDLNHCIEAVKALAKFHAVTHHLHVTHKLPEISSMNTQFIQENGVLMYNRLKNFDDIIENLTEFGVEEYNKTIKDLQPVVWQKIVDCLNQDFEFLSLVHGDFWTTNMMFKYDRNNKVTHAKIIDYQLIRVSTPAFDLHFFICTSMLPRVRDNHLHEILEVYLDTLNSTLKKIGSKSFLTQEKFDKMMDDTKFVGLYSTLTFLPIVLCESPLNHIPPPDLPEEKRKYFTPFIEVFKQNTYRKQLVSMLDYYKKQNII